MKKPKILYVSIIIASFVIAALYFNLSSRYSFICVDSFKRIESNTEMRESLGYPLTVRISSIDETIGHSNLGETLWTIDYTIEGSKDNALVSVVMIKNNNQWQYERLKLYINQKEINMLNKGVN